MKRTKRYLYLLAICNSKTQYNFNFNKRPAVNFAPTNFKQAFPPPLSQEREAFPILQTFYDFLSFQTNNVCEPDHRAGVCARPRSLLVPGVFRFNFTRKHAAPRAPAYLRTNERYKRADNVRESRPLLSMGQVDCACTALSGYMSSIWTCGGRPSEIARTNSSNHFPLESHDISAARTAAI